MYEAEVNRVTRSLEVLPQAVRERFAESRPDVVGRTVLPWGEHCTECNFPSCYTTCELYTPRQDGACRLFVDGMVRIDHPQSFNGYVLEVRFKRWGKLWTVANRRLVTMDEAGGREQSNIRRGALARNLPLPGAVKARVLRKVSYVRRVEAEQATVGSEIPDHFLFECYNPNDRTVLITFVARPRGADMSASFQHAISAAPGFTRERIPYDAMSRKLPEHQSFEIEIIPNECENTVLYLGAMDFVKVRPAPAKPTNGAPRRTWKCIVWDLDNTLWDGTLIEDGPDKLKVRQEVIDVIKATDQRGILHSIASKNHHADAVKVLQASGIEEYFLYPQIGWEPKSQSIARIVQLLNIGADTVAFVDDQPFERQEVKRAIPELTVLDAREAPAIPDLPECAVPVTAESKQRRSMYLQQQKRELALQAHGGDYKAFLRECEICLDITALSEENIERVYELAQRTNQMNFSGNRYPQSQLREMLKSSARETFVMRCKDKFGSYGIVGFAVVDAADARLLDLMFSCRIQSKRVEHAFLTWLLQRFVGREKRDFFANYCPTPKNSAAGKVFDDIGFERVSEADGLVSLAFRNDRTIADDGIVTIRVT